MHHVCHTRKDKKRHPFGRRAIKNVFPLQAAGLRSVSISFSQSTIRFQVGMFRDAKHSKNLWDPIVWSARPETSIYQITALRKLRRSLNNPLCAFRFSAPLELRWPSRSCDRLETELNDLRLSHFSRSTFVKRSVPIMPSLTVGLTARFITHLSMLGKY